MIKRLLKRFKKEVPAAPDRVVTAALRAVRERAKADNSFIAPPMPKPEKSASAASDPGDIHAENNAEIDRVMEQKRGALMVMTKHRKVVNFRVWGNC